MKSIEVKFKVGDTVWYYGDRLESAKIISISLYDKRDIYYTDGTDGGVGYVDSSEHKLYSYKKDAVCCEISRLKSVIEALESEYDV